jgi:AraC family transcriptional regulator
MQARIENFASKKFIGKRIRTTLAEHKTQELWRSFMPRRKEIAHPATTDLYSIEIYDSSLDFNQFDHNTPFDKWAAVEVYHVDNLPDDMDAFEIPEGMYAVFVHKGSPNAAPATFNYIFKEWLPSSEFVLDNRPHFEIMGDKYKPAEADCEEELWIPIKHKNRSV